MFNPILLLLLFFIISVCLHIFFCDDFQNTLVYNACIIISVSLLPQGFVRGNHNKCCQCVILLQFQKMYRKFNILFMTVRPYYSCSCNILIIYVQWCNTGLIKSLLFIVIIMRHHLIFRRYQNINLIKLDLKVSPDAVCVARSCGGSGVAAVQCCHRVQKRLFHTQPTLGRLEETSLPHTQEKRSVTL